MKVQATLSRRLRIIGSLLVGATVAGTALALALQKTLQAEESSNTERRETLPDRAEEPQGREIISDSNGIVSMKQKNFEIAGLTHPGKRRHNNQDAFKIGTLKPAGQEYTLAIVCDGMGGHAGGEVASQIATDLIWTVVSKQKDGDIESLYHTMAGALERADSAIEQRASKEPDLKGMGTTAVLAAISDQGYVHCHLGDSRLYHFSQGQLLYHTKDHSVVRFLVEEGIITSAEAKDHPYRSQLTSSLGGGPNANRLTIEPKWDESKSPYREWTSGDWLLLCSDGLNSELEDKEIADILQGSDGPQSAIERLRERVLETEARDNVTLIVAHRL